ncbi:cob(I)yrinic acid a,c-diamide adenosyltransferase [Klebsiella pneumoniae]|nr:cob(I)yrinic acid a,c-diamide adenosyltransferase [Klebsiella pneumoniae]SXJ96209.1 cob(I)yrinic acid a,c-diamide adenosyltransferase [Klebsiella pneumoniae]
MNDFITEAWLRANHTLSEGGEIHLPADARLTPSARELLESRHLRVKFLDRQGRLFVEDDEQTPQPVHVLTSSDHPPQACCELCHQPVGKKPDTLTHLTADTLVAKNDPRLAFRAVLDSTIALAVQLEGGCHHTAAMHSRNIDNMNQMANAIDTSIFVKNGPCIAGLGLGGEGWTTMTITTPTGEGVTSARTFVRLRRCVLVDAFRIV